MEMLSKSKQCKINRKQKRSQALITAETGILSSDTPTKFLGICNSGLSSGLAEEELLEEAVKYGIIRDVVMPINKSYCFLICEDVEHAKQIYFGMHAKSTLGQCGCVLYISYFQNAPQIKKSRVLHPPGLLILENFVNAEEERSLLKAIQIDCIEPEIHSSLKHRTVKHFGYEFLYGSNNVDVNNPLSQEIPKECNILFSRLKEKLPELQWHEPDQLTVNQYKPGQGIPPHVDTHSAFSDPILSLSLESDIVMEFKNKGRHLSVNLPRHSLLVMTGESRYDWTHAIVPRCMDFLHTEKGTLTVVRRSKRTSLTFRKIRQGACECLFPNLCDSQKQQQKELKILVPEVAKQLEHNNVHKVYDEIANHFSETRHTPWPRVAEFFNSFPLGSVVIDIGCGNGKYLQINKNITKIGCDRSKGLLDVCIKNNFNVFKCDCLNVPVRDNSVNGCCSIAVIHHLATEERRLKAMIEMKRILVSGGKALIYVWSKNQEADAKKSKYLRQNKNIGNTESKQEINTNTNIVAPKSNVDLPIHTNRTQFQEQDIFVPWKLKSKTINEEKTFLRYYHVFEDGELENMCKKIKGIHIEELYYDQGNWCVRFTKL